LLLGAAAAEPVGAAADALPVADAAADALATRELAWSGVMVVRRELEETTSVGDEPEDESVALAVMAEDAAELEADDAEESEGGGGGGADESELPDDPEPWREAEASRSWTVSM
jgi:hypothetical protein